MVIYMNDARVTFAGAVFRVKAQSKVTFWFDSKSKDFADFETCFLYQSIVKNKINRIKIGQTLTYYLHSR